LYKKKSILCLIPARAGSKGIKNKNLKRINKKSLTQITCELCSRIKYIDNTVLSTDSLKLIKQIQKFKTIEIIKRPKYLSGDRIADIDLLIYNLKKIEEKNKKKYDFIIYLQPTSLGRTINMINKFITKMVNSKVQAIWSVSKIDLKYHPYKVLKNTNKGNLCLFSNKGKNIIARQQLQSMFIRNGIFYGFSRNQILINKSIYAKEINYIITKNKNFNIDTMKQLEEARFYFKDNLL